MKCLRKFKWVMLLREGIPAGKGIMGAWMRLVSRAAYRKGKGRYCGHENDVTPGMWAGGVVGLKSIMGVRRRAHAMFQLSRLEEWGYVDYDRDPKTKKLTYEIKDFVLKCTGKPCMDGAVYATDGYGFVCVPRNITERLVEKGYVFEELDAWLDLWCHTVFLDYGNAYSFLAPAVQYGKYGSVLTLETLGKRWGWEKTKVWRFFRKFEKTFALYRLPSSYGCVIYNLNYPSETEIARPDEEDVMRITDLMRISARNTHCEASENARINRIVAWRSRRIVKKLQEESAQNEYGESALFSGGSGSRVAVSDTITRAYFSHGRNCKYSRNCINDCRGTLIEPVWNLLNFDIGVLYPFSGSNPFLDDS